MNKLSFFMTLLCIAFISKAQLTQVDFSEDYNSSLNWIPVNDHLDQNHPVSNDIIVQNGHVDFNDAINGGNDVRVYRHLGRTLCDNFWVAQFELEPQGTNTLFGHNVFCLTANNLSPTRDNDLNWLDNDCINVLFYTPSSGSARMRVEMNDNGSMTFSDYIVTPATDDYVVRLERIDLTRGRLTVTNLTTQETESVCFDIPSTIRDLTYLQHANYTRSSEYRHLEAYVDNSKIWDCQADEECCINSNIVGPNILCIDGGLIPAVLNYSVTDDPDATYNWSIVPSSGVSFSGQGTHSIALSTSGLSAGSYNIIVEIECRCHTTIDTLELVVNDVSNVDDDFTPDLNVDPNNNNQYNSVDITPDNGGAPTGMTNEWFMYYADNCDQGDYTISTQNPNPIATGTSTGTNNLTLNFGGVPITDCYVFRRIIRFDNGCDAIEEWKKVGNITIPPPSIANSGSGTSYSGKQVQLFPNPTNESLNISSDDPKNKVLKVDIYNLGGQLIYSVNNNEETTTMMIDLNHFNRGNYIAVIELSDGKVVSKEFAKQ